MDTTARPLLLFALLTWCFAHSSEFGATNAPARPDFTGNWLLDHTRSRLEIKAPDTTLFEIAHNEPVWRVKRTHVYEGKPDTNVTELTIGAEPVESQWERGTRTSKIDWRENALELTLNFSTTSGDAWDVVVRYRLTDDGKTFVAEETMEGGTFSYNNSWVFSRVK